MQQEWLFRGFFCCWGFFFVCLLAWLVCLFEVFCLFCDVLTLCYFILTYINFPVKTRMQCKNNLSIRQIKKHQASNFKKGEQGKEVVPKASCYFSLRRFFNLLFSYISQCAADCTHTGFSCGMNYKVELGNILCVLVVYKY